jgi:hypothetical protein
MSCQEQPTNEVYMRVHGWSVASLFVGVVDGSHIDIGKGTYNSKT